MGDEITDRIGTLEQHIAELQDELKETRRQLTEAQLDKWKGRIDELEVQMSLGRLEATEQMNPVLEQLRNRWLDAQRQLSGATSTGRDVFGSLRSGVESAWDDLRKAIDDARGAGED